MRKLIQFALLLGAFNLSTAYSQDIQPYLNMIARGQVDSVRRQFKKLAYQNPGSEAINYLRALIETDASKAVAIYKDILRNHTSSPYAPSALMYLGEYYYAQGLFIQSQSILKQLIRKYPAFPRVDYAANLMLRGEIVADAIDTAKADLEWVRSINPNLVIDIPSELKDVQPMHEAALEIMELNAERKADDNHPTKLLGQPPAESLSSPAEIPHYTLQCGAFSKQENAHLLAQQIRSLGYTVQIVSRDTGGQTLFVVLAGKFADRNQAKVEAKNIQYALGIGKPFLRSLHK